VFEYVGGYEDWIRQRPPAVADGAASAAPPVTPSPHGAAPPVPASRPRKASFKERRELEALPARIDALDAERRALTEAMASPDFYRKPAAEIRATLQRLDAIEPELAAAYARWDELDSIVT
jgi:ATP-binding cassette subfamily F protein uup